MEQVRQVVVRRIEARNRAKENDIDVWGSWIELVDATPEQIAKARQLIKRAEKVQDREITEKEERRVVRR